MLTYQLQKRVCMIKNEKELTFPSDVEIEVCLEPTEQFGIGEKLSKTALQGSEGRLIYDANTGKWGFKSSSPLQPIEVVVEWLNLRLEMQGNIVKAKTHCRAFKDMNDLLIALHYLFPILLNLEFAEPPTVKYTRGRVGEAIFNWELAKATQFIDITTKERQEKRVVDSFKRLVNIGNVSIRRLAAALFYFYVARRLVESGNSPYEFLSEVIHNLNKILEILFGSQKDKVRNELSKFGYSQDEIESKFIPIMILRNEFDVGHASITIFKTKQLAVLYQYLEYSEKNFRDLLERVVKKIEGGDYALPHVYDLTLEKSKLRTLNKLVAVFEKVTNQRKTT